ncbi:MAG: tetratricopeptide repeat protein [Phycisphaerae bacterium]
MISKELAEKLVRASRPLRGLHGSRMVLLGIGLLLGAALARPEYLAQGSIPLWVWPHVVLLFIVAVILLKLLRQQRQARLTLAAFESLQLQEWEQARRHLVKLLTRPVNHAPARTEALLGLGSLAEIGHDYDAAQQVYQAILDEAVANPVQLLMTRIALAATLLRTGQTADAVDMVDRLARTSLPDSLKAHVEMVSLFREIVMGHAADGLAKADYRRALFREHLGTRAGYGYALLAAAYDQANLPSLAQKCWEDATLLVRADTLVERFGELTSVAARYVPVEHML